MPVETPSLFAEIIQDHLRLKEQNSRLEERMPIGRYKSQDPFENHPLFKTEEQARIEDTMSGEQSPPAEHAARAWGGDESVEAHGRDSALWSRSRDFDWGD